MEKIHENMCFDVVFLYKNIRTCLFTYVFLYFLHLVLTFTPHYIIMVKGLLKTGLSKSVKSSRQAVWLLILLDSGKNGSVGPVKQNIK